MCPLARKGERSFAVLVFQVLILVAFLSAWQFLPQVQYLKVHSNHVLDSYFISSPTKTARKMWQLATGGDNSVVIWKYVWNTVYASLLGTIAGMVAGGVSGLVLSNFPFWGRVMRPYIVAVNAMPRIALIPIVMIMFGLKLQTMVIIAVLVVYFVAFFSAYEGGVSMKPEIIYNAQLLGGNSWRILARVRLPFVVAWTLTSLPLAITFAVLSVVTGEILTGYPGLGQLLTTAAVTGDSSLTFSIVIYLSVVGVVLVQAAELVRRRVLHWWAK
jgi:NitT/TauT family transport system permease protein